MVAPASEGGVKAADGPHIDVRGEGGEGGMVEVVCAARRENILGEGPVWDARAGRLWWLDIKGQRLEWLEPKSAAAGGVDLERQVTAVAPRLGGPDLLAATETGVGILDPRTGAYVQRLDPEPDRPGNRANDGNVDVAGRFWFGTMDDAERAISGAIYRLDADWTCTRVLDDIGISNTLVCSPRGERLYVADSMAGTIDILDIDPVTGATGARRPFARTRGQGVGPDGSAVDAEGFLWNCEWGGARIVRYAPDGSVERVLPVPVDQPTSCAFGGEDLATLYITTARKGLSDQALARQPLAGSLLSCRPGVTGLSLPPFAG
jgi:L-arabinonolactonase